MRIIAGSARGRRLQTFEVKGVRPTSDRAREALFSMLQSRCGGFAGLRVLDLFAGTGALGLEALSRGAAEAWLVEQDPRAAALIQANIDHCGFDANCRLRRGDVRRALTDGSLRGPFDLIFLDPPYGQGLVPFCLDILATGGLLTEHGMVCAESSSMDEVPDRLGSLVRLTKRRYGAATIHLFSRSAADEVNLP